jgi:hypothetical protein
MAEEMALWLLLLADFQRRVASDGVREELFEVL